MIEERAFYNCTSLTNITILGKETAIGENALYKANQVVIYCMESSIAQTYAEANNIPYVLLSAPSAVLTLPASLTAIESEAFAGLTVDVIVIPATVQSIAPDAFSDTGAVLSVTAGSYAENWAKEHQIQYRTE